MLKTTKPAKIHGVPAGTPNHAEGNRTDARHADWFNKTLRLAKDLRIARERTEEQKQTARIRAKLGLR